MNCQHCGKPLTPPKVPRRRRKYCSDGCRRAADRARKDARPRSVERTEACAICGSSIVQPATGRPRKYCEGCVVLLNHQRSHKIDTATFDPGFVYLMHTTHGYKIGWTHNVARRRRALKATLLWTITTHHPKRLERALLKHFAAKCIHGEYFDLAPSDLQWVQRLGDRLPDGRLPIS